VSQGVLKNEEEKLVLLGDEFASAPSTFKFSFGEKLMLNDVINMAKHILLEYSANTTGSLIKRPRFDYVRLAGEKSAVSDEVECVASASTTTTKDPATTASTINETENSAALVPLTRKGKTLHDYLMKWFMNKKLIAEKQITFVMGDCEVISENSTIKCLKCNVIIKSHVDDNGGWKKASFAIIFRDVIKLPLSHKKQYRVNVAQIQHAKSQQVPCRQSAKKITL
jgi:hypothetical protein